MKIGTDIIEIKRIAKAIEKPKFLQKYYTENEINLIKKRGTKVAATNFAGKEAVSKAFGTGFLNFGPIDIEILRAKSGEPFVVLHKNAKQIFYDKYKFINISLSNSKDYALAMVIFS
ncbi:MAG: holo-ACP synthase [Defluviitaleaceae bacterium]|nr:holo-ACP synthase [Defluviitaleaceae bacterium]